MVSISNILLAASIAAGVQAKSWQLHHYASEAVNGCSLLIGKQATWATKHDLLGFCKKDDQPALGSMAWCLENQPKPEEAKHAFIKQCDEEYGLKVTMEDLQHAYQNATDYLVENPKKTIPGWNPKKPASVPVKFTDEEYDTAYLSAIYRFMNVNWLMWFGIALFGYWFAIMFVAGAYNALFYIAPGFTKRLQNPIINTWRKYVTLPALFNQQHVNPAVRMRWFCWLVPTRWEAVMMGGYLTLVIIFNACLFHKLDGNIYFSTSAMFVAKQVANRSGLSTIYIIPQLILFAGRNNFMQWVTGWSYSRFIYLHKWLARVAVILVLTHAIAYTVKSGGFNGDKYIEYLTEDFFRWGIAALTCGSIMCFQALYFMRHMNYEFFLLLHILLAVFFIVGGWIHTADQGYEQWFIAATAVWCFDRAIRLGRLAFFGIRKANVQLVGEDTLRVTVTRPKWWTPFPGCHAFIHFVRPTVFWQSHPFTVVGDAAEADGSGTITLYLKVKGGVTHGLCKYLSKCPGKSAKVPVAIEGPYGTRLPLDRYDTLVFITGGHGIPGLYSQAREIISRAGSKTRVKFYWTIRNYQAIEWFYPELQKFNNDQIETIVYVSQPREVNSPIVLDEDSSMEKKSCNEETIDHVETLKLRLDHFVFREGRPDIDELVATEAAESLGSIAFTTCGAGTLVDASRRAVANNFEKCSYRVDYYEQAQIW